jgi:hypothetical protein
MWRNDGCCTNTPVFVDYQILALDRDGDSPPRLSRSQGLVMVTLWEAKTRKEPR